MIQPREIQPHDGTDSGPRGRDGQDISMSFVLSVPSSPLRQNRTNETMSRTVPLVPPPKFKSFNTGSVS
jgi:hypothetical protein